VTGGYAIRNQEALALADILVSIFCRFGVLRELQSDQGRNFEPSLLQEVLQRLGKNKT
jgi:hypothetical protein